MEEALSGIFGAYNISFLPFDPMYQVNDQVLKIDHLCLYTSLLHEKVL